MSPLSDSGRRDTRWRRAIALIAALALAGCAHHVPPRTRAARTMVAAGAVLVVLGGLAVAGCADVSDNGSGCKGGPRDSDLRLGLPIVAVGSGLVAAGLLVRPDRSQRLFKPARATPPAKLPDPFVPPLPPVY